MALSEPPIDERLADSPTRALLVYVVLRKHGPLRLPELIDVTARSRETVRRGLRELEDALEDDFIERRDPEDLRRRIYDVE